MVSKPDSGSVARSLVELDASSPATHVLAQFHKDMANFHNHVLQLLQLLELPQKMRSPRSESKRECNSTVDLSLPGYQISKVKPVNFPTFDGNSDMAEWRYKAHQYFYMHRFNAEKRVEITSYHLTGRAMIWCWEYSSQRNNNLSWQELLEALEAQYGTSSHMDPREELSRLKQTTSVDQDYDQFEQISNKIAGILDEHLKGTFIGGLKEDIGYDMKAFERKDLLEAVNVTRFMEAKANVRKTRTFEHRLVPNEVKPPLVSLPATSHV